MAIGRPRGSKNKPKVAKPSAPVVVDSDDDDDEVVEPAETPEIPTGPIPVEEALMRQALTSDAQDKNAKLRRIVGRKRKGERRVAWDSERMDLFNAVKEVFGQQAINIQVEKTFPVVSEHGTVPFSTFQAYQDLVDYIKENFWNGERATYRWTVRKPGFAQLGSSSMPFDEDPVAKAKWAQKSAQAAATVTALSTGAAQQPIVLAAPNQPSDQLLRRLEHLERNRAEQEQQFVYENEDEMNAKPPPHQLPAGYKWEPRYDETADKLVWAAVPIAAPAPTFAPAPAPAYGYPQAQHQPKQEDDRLDRLAQAIESLVRNQHSQQVVAPAQLPIVPQVPAPPPIPVGAMVGGYRWDGSAWVPGAMPPDMSATSAAHVEQVRPRSAAETIGEATKVLKSLEDFNGLRRGFFPEARIPKADEAVAVAAADAEPLKAVPLGAGIQRFYEKNEPVDGTSQFLYNVPSMLATLGEHAEKVLDRIERKADKERDERARRDREQFEQMRSHVTARERHIARLEAALQEKAEGIAPLAPVELEEVASPPPALAPPAPPQRSVSSILASLDRKKIA